ncbi:MAG: hypothetical protein OXF65_16070, partial [Acidimicrobiaceae bacterium]|nr:hypothetical protein [Acidimicrobiaceae bacterium]
PRRRSHRQATGHLPTQKLTPVATKAAIAAVTSSHSSVVIPALSRARGDAAPSTAQTARRGIDDTQYSGS